jgi:hypothetical protein
MSTLRASLAVFVLSFLASATAEAASPTYCALYAREYANEMVKIGATSAVSIQLQDRAYYRCLNQDEVPALPSTSAYFDANIGDLTQVPAEGDASENTRTTVAVSEQPKPSSPPKKADAAPVQKVAASSQAADYDTSGYQAWTPEWQAWCKEHFPNSFNEKTGKVFPYKTKKWRMCE